MQSEGGLYYSSTSGTYFKNKESLNEHYKSDFHRYNLRRKVAGLPPVTREWFEARKSQLEQLEAARGIAGSHKKIWVCPLTKKKFQSLNTYNTYRKSKKFQDLMKKQGIESVPEPIVKVLQLENQDEGVKQKKNINKSGEVKGSGFAMKPVATGTANTDVEEEINEEQEEEEDVEEEGWETASDEEEGDGMDASNWEEWDVTLSLFDNNKSETLEANLEYMYKKYGFYFPETENLIDPEGLIKYLGAKLKYGRVPLYSRGDDENAKQFRDLQAVQNHMIHINNCKMCWEDNEEEYEDFYNWPENSQEQQQQNTDSDIYINNNALSVSDQIAQPGTGGYELMLPNEDGSGGVKILGSREFARYYKQKPKYLDTRKSVVAGSIVAQYRQLGIATAQEKREQKDKKKAAAQSRQWYEKNRLRKEMANNLNWNLPKNVPY
eukprot:TRINITY_DN11423_c0_g2_i1.p2 TRINITY_DN11423_c0_g2~~TRINITY_DN11423_c0_g2_i1.p2  ORF type:complete len:471 (-),score=101.47 TRINITY_DN11423_c0_g2_i1:775-2082(-)